MKATYQNQSFCNTYTDIIPNRHNKTEAGWRDGMVIGNGEQGVVSSGSPYAETLIYQNMFFLMPTGQPRFTPPEVTAELQEARQAVIQFDDTWNVHDRKRTYLYRFHPGHQVRICMPKAELLEFTRETDYTTGEIKVRYRDTGGNWERNTFTSWCDNVTITKYNKSHSGTLLNADISLDDISSMRKFGYDFFTQNQKLPEENMQYKKLAEQDGSMLALVAHYPSYQNSELKDGGYAGITKIITVGGKRELVLGDVITEGIYAGNQRNPVVCIRDAEEIVIISKTARTHNMGSLEEFESMESYEVLNSLLSDVNAIVLKYTDDSGVFSYDHALSPHHEMQAGVFQNVTFHLESGDDRYLCNEDLLKKQKASIALLPALVERVYNQGRFVQICCSGHSSPRLCGLWTGEWNPGWSGAYTMDANVNLQASGMNTGNVYPAALGFIYFVLRQIKDWEENAAMIYGMKDALLVPVNTDGDVAVMVEYDYEYPFQYWNAGASWMLLPIFEFWQCYGNQKIPVTSEISHLYNTNELDLEADILYPLLTKQANFWAQLCTPEYFTDIAGAARYQKGKKTLNPGERYIILPSYSPENKPKGYNSTITANATMDIAAARDGLKMIIQIEKTRADNDWQKAVEKWERLISQLPEYQFDETGAIREWAMAKYKENNEHRHISHLYCAWPAYEAHNNDALTAACNIAIANRNRENTGKDDTASHGWVHKALVAARLRNAESAYDLLYTLLSSDIYFASLMTDHNTDRSFGVYCTDTSLGIVGIINELLLYSDTGTIEFLPALPKQWSVGSISGLMARTNAKVTKLEWDLSSKRMNASVLSAKDQTIQIKLSFCSGKMRTSKGEIKMNGEAIRFLENEEISFSFDIEPRQTQPSL